MPLTGKRGDGERRAMFLETDDRFFLRRRFPVAKALMDRGIRVGAAMGTGEAREEIEAAGVTYYPVRFLRGNLNPLLEMAALGDVYAAYRDFDPHLVHQLTFKPIVLGTIAARTRGIRPMVNTITGLGYVFTGTGLKQRLLRPIAKAGYRVSLQGKYTRVILQNPDDRAYFRKHKVIYRDNDRLILGSGVDTARFSPAPDPEGIPTVLFPSRMLTDKGLPELIGAARLLKGMGIAFQLKLAGLPDAENPATIDESQLRSWEEEGLCTWVGFQQDMPALLNQANIVCLPSHREGLPVALLEAASCGRPIVTTDAPGCREIVRDEHNGLLVPVKDASALAAALRRLIDDPGLRRRFGMAGRTLVLEQFSIEQVVSRTLDVYAEVAGANFLAP